MTNAKGNYYQEKQQTKRYLLPESVNGLVAAYYF